MSRLISFSIFLVAAACGANAQSQALLSVLECDSCSEEQRAQRAIDAGLGFHYVVDFGPQAAIRYYRVENMLAGAGGSANETRSTSIPGRQFMLGAVELVVPETAQAAFDQFNAVYQEAKSAHQDTIEIGPRDFYSTPIQILSPLARDRLTADVRQDIVYGLPGSSPARTRFMMTQGGVTFDLNSPSMPDLPVSPSTGSRVTSPCGCGCVTRPAVTSTSNTRAPTLTVESSTSVTRLVSSSTWIYSHSV